MKQIALSASLAALLAAGPALAADLKGDAVTGVFATKAEPWTGPYIALGAGYEANSIDIGEDEEVGSFAMSADGVIVTGRVGYDKQFGRAVVGVFGDVAWSNAEVAKNFDEADLAYAAGARAGIVLGGSLLYANAGWEWQEFDKAAGYSPDGFFAGGGIEASLGAGLSLAIEGRHSWRSDMDVDNDATSARVMLIRKF